MTNDNIINRSSPIADAIHERRMKIVSLPARFLVDIFNWWRKPPHFYALPINDELPEDCYVVSVNTNWQSNTIELIVASSEFDPVDDCCEFPRINNQEIRVISFDELTAKETESTTN